MTKLLGTLLLIVMTMQASDDYYRDLIPPKYHPAMHGALLLCGLILWAIQTNYGPGGKLMPKPDTDAGNFTQAVAKFRGKAPRG